MGISPQKTIVHQLEQKFLFSELEETENRNISETEDNNPKAEQDVELQCVQSLWIKFTVLIDRVMFYLLCLVILLFIISVIVTE